MKKYLNNSQEFVNNWCKKFNVPKIKVKLIPSSMMEINQEIIEPTLYLDYEKIKNKGYWKYVLLHEIVHWVLANKSNNDLYMDESVVEIITNEIFQEFYLNDWKKLCLRNLI